MSACQSGQAAAGQTLGARPAALPGRAPEPLSSTEVLRGHKSVSIEHEGVIYRLQVTRLGKLILTK